MELSEGDDLDDVALHKALWSIIEGLARLRVFLDQTDHLSDRELHTQLVRELLPEEMPALDADENSVWHIDVLGYDKPELYLKYYADEKTRESWRIDFPDDPIPAHEDPPYDRDSDLQQNWVWPSRVSLVAEGHGHWNGGNSWRQETGRSDRQEGGFVGRARGPPAPRSASCPWIFCSDTI